MRILISNPDGIGDLTLRQPLFAALLGAGHHLALLVRSSAAPLVRWLAPGAELFELRDDPYRPQFDRNSASVEQLLQAARAFSPDLYAIAPFQRTVLDELLAESLTDTPVIGFNGYLYRGDMGAGLDLQSRMQSDVTVPVSVEMHELAKNEALCGAILHRRAALPPPRIALTERDRESARAVLMQTGVSPGEYWVACVGNSVNNAARNWGLGEWAAALVHLVERHSRRVIFTGSPDESGATEKIRSLMGNAANSTINLCAASSSLETLIGLLELSEGYIGRDTGPMHIAAAVSKPVLAVFGAGNWPRFTPAARRGLSFVMKLPCSGCNYVCHLADTYCIKRVPVHSVTSGLDDLLSGKVERMEARALEPDPLLTAHLIREGAFLSIEKERRAAANQQRLATLLTQESQRQVCENQLRAELQSEKVSLSAAIADRDQARSEAALINEERHRLEELLRLSAEKLRSVEADREACLADVTSQLRAALEARAQLASLLQFEQNRLRLALIDAETARARESRQTGHLLALLNDCRREIEALTVEHAALLERPQDGTAAALKPGAANPGSAPADSPIHVPQGEIPLSSAVQNAIRQVAHARGNRVREIASLARAAAARAGRQLGIVRSAASRG